MRCLVLGGDGMLGHQLLKSWQANCDVKVTLRNRLSDYQHHGIFNSVNSIPSVDILDTARLRQVVTEYRPDAVINAVGVIKQRDAAHEHIPCIEINALFPHRLREICEEASCRLIHMSTDCVFSGEKGNYTEDDTPDAKDLYGRTKLLGEVDMAPGLTLRSSIIGLELKNHRSLIDWYLAQKGTIKGFCNAIYSGLTTVEMARVIWEVLTKHPRLTGVWQVASEPISKFELLQKLGRLLQRTDIHLVPDYVFCCNRSLDGTKFAKSTGIEVADWDTMLQGLTSQILSKKGLTHVA